MLLAPNFSRFKVLVTIFDQMKGANQEYFFSSYIRYNCGLHQEKNEFR
jgi:hypothetical protein